MLQCNTVSLELEIGGIYAPSRCSRVHDNGVSKYSLELPAPKGKRVSGRSRFPELSAPLPRIHLNIIPDKELRPRRYICVRESVPALTFSPKLPRQSDYSYSIVISHYSSRSSSAHDTSDSAFTRCNSLTKNHKRCKPTALPSSSCGIPYRLLQRRFRLFGIGTTTYAT